MARLMAPLDIDDSSARDDAKQFLREILSDGEMPAKDVLAEARECGIAEKTLRRAAKELGVDIAHLGKRGEKGGGKWAWRMPQQDGQNITSPKDGHLANSPDTEERISKMVIGHLDGGHLANPSPEKGSDANPTQISKMANDHLDTPPITPEQASKMANCEARDLAILLNPESRDVSDEDDAEVWLL
jgi:hypothetical protein